MDLGFHNSTAVIVGGASGIGRACAQTFASEGVRVVVWDRVVDNPETSHDQHAAHHIAVDISDSQAVQDAVAQTLSLSGTINHLVNAAAVGSGKFGAPFTHLNPADWTRVLEVNVGGMVNVAHAVAPHMIEQQGGTMVFVASVAGQVGSPTDPPYSASKAANINFAQVMARDLACHGIRVNTVCPGMVKTPLNRSVWQSWNERQSEQDQLSYDDWAAQKIKQLVPLGRWQKAEDIADMIVFLSSDRAAQVTGQTINVDGGYVMHA